MTPRAQLPKLPPPGIPSGEASSDGEPLQNFSPSPEMSYEKRSFTTSLPQTWAGEVPSISVADVEDSSDSNFSNQIEVPDESTNAFIEYSELVKSEREAALAEQARRSAAPASGRPTCGDEEGRAVVSNFLTQYLEGVKCVEYWGVPNGPVPKLFDGPSA